jgi:hypothetical protein
MHHSVANPPLPEVIQPTLLDTVHPITSSSATIKCTGHFIYSEKYLRRNGILLGTRSEIYAASMIAVLPVTGTSGVAGAVTVAPTAGVAVAVVVAPTGVVPVAGTIAGALEPTACMASEVGEVALSSAGVFSIPERTGAGGGGGGGATD